MPKHTPARFTAIVAALMVSLSSAQITHAASDAENASALLDALLGQVTPSGPQDINHDGKLNAIDLALMKRAVLPASPVLTNQDDTLTIVGSNLLDDESVLQQLTETFPHKEHIQIVSFGKDATEFGDHLKTYLASGEDADLLVLTDENHAKFQNDDSVTLPLSAIGFSDGAFRDCFSGTLPLGCNENGVLHAIPFAIKPSGYAYRIDYAEEYLGIKTRDEMQSVFFNWDSMEACAKTLAKYNISMFSSLEEMLLPETTLHPEPWVQNNQLVNDTQFLEIAERAKYWYEQGYTANYEVLTDKWYDILKQPDVFGCPVKSWMFFNDEFMSANEMDMVTNPNQISILFDMLRNISICAGPSLYYADNSYLAPAATCNSLALAHDFVDFAVCDADALSENVWLGYYSAICNNRTAISRADPTEEPALCWLFEPDTLPLTILSDFADTMDTSHCSPYNNAMLPVLTHNVNAYIQKEIGQDTFLANLHDAAATLSDTTPSDTPFPKLQTDDTLKILAWGVDSVALHRLPQFKDVSFISCGEYGGTTESILEELTLAGEDVDMFIITSDDEKKILENSSLAKPLSSIGFTDEDFSCCFPATLDLNRNSNGELMAIAYAVNPSAYIYREDLAEQYLGVHTPAEMQAVFKDFDTMEAAAETLASHDISMIDSFDTFLNLALQNHTEKWIEDNTVTDSPFFKSFAQRCLNWYDQDYIRHSNLYTENWYREAIQGNTLGFFMTCADAEGDLLEQFAGGPDTVLHGSIHTELYGKFNICQGISPYMQNNYSIAISTACNSPELAKEFITALVLDTESLKQHPLIENCLVNNREAAKAAAAQKSTHPLYAKGVTPLTTFIQNAEQINAVNSTLQDCDVFEAYSYAFSDYYYDSGTTVDDFMEYFYDEIDYVMNDVIPPIYDRDEEEGENDGNGFFITEDGTLTKYEGDATEVVIPDTVSVIGKNAFSENNHILSVVIPSSVQSIASSAFYDCMCLRYLDVAEGLTTIGEECFVCCDLLEDVNLPSTLIKIGRFTFDDCDRLTLHFPNGQNVEYNTKHPIDNIRAEYQPFNPNTIIDAEQYLLAEFESFTIPNTVTVIGPYAFSRCENLKEITIPGNVTIVSGFAFFFDEALTTVHIEEGCEELCLFTFACCSSLTDVYLPASMTHIDIGTFMVCSDTLTIHAPAGSYAEQYAENNGIHFEATT